MSVAHVANRNGLQVTIAIKKSRQESLAGARVLLDERVPPRMHAWHPVACFEPPLADGKYGVYIVVTTYNDELSKKFNYIIY